MGGQEETVTLQMTAKELVHVKGYLDELLHVFTFDPESNGLIIGGRPSVTKIGLAINCSFQSIEAAAQRNCELLVTHHAVRTSTDAHLAEQKYDRLRTLGINLYVAHESLEVAREIGTADALARTVRVATQAAFSPDGEREFGLHGTTTGQFAQFVARVGTQLGSVPRSWKNSDSFGHVGVVAGSGGKPEWMSRAQALGCDTFLTGEAGMFGILFAREAGLNLVLASHMATEAPAVMALGARLARDLNVDVTFIPEDLIE
jgi:putative NIF3 family GTP cyclohydrolase 1 type 2